MNNPLLLNLDGFSGINSEGSALFIVGNTSLNDITGVSNITMVNNAVGIDISNNPNLSFCSLPNLCNYFLNPTGSIINNVSNNAPGCDNQEELLFGCDALARIKNFYTFQILA